MSKKFMVIDEKPPRMGKAEIMRLIKDTVRPNGIGMKDGFPGLEIQQKKHDFLSVRLFEFHGFGYIIKYGEEEFTWHHF